MMNSRERNIQNRRIKRESKRREEEIARIRKGQANAAREKMISDKMENIVESVRNGQFSRNLLEKLLVKATTPFEHRNEGYVTISKGTHKLTCASVLSMVAVENVISNKRKADELSRLAAKRRRLTGQKLKRNPNTTRGDFRIIVGINLEQVDKAQESNKAEKQKKKLVDSIKKKREILTKWNDLLRTKTAAAEAKGIPIADGSWWKIQTESANTKANRCLFLKMCVPGSGVLGKKESEQLQVLVKHDVTYLKLLSVAETLQKELTSLQKEYDECMSSSAFLLSSVEKEQTEDYNEEDEDILEPFVEL